MNRFCGCMTAVFLSAVLDSLVASNTSATDLKPLEFQITFDKAVSNVPFTGRVYVMLSTEPIHDLLGDPDWFDPQPLFAVDVKDWRPGEPLVMGASALGFPGPLNRLPPRTYYLQAVMDFDRGSASFSTADGNGYSKAIRLTLDPAKSGRVPLSIRQVYRARKFVDTDTVKLVDIESKLLSAFYGRPTRMRAGVILPRSFVRNPGKRYPVIYDIPGFGGDHFIALQMGQEVTDVAGVDMMYVVLDPTCRLGHHVFTDSENNGPRGRALVEELIPYIEKHYRGLAVPTARFVTGHSSGGWSSLWLQITFPDFFGGTWSTAPDEVDFRDFQRANIYQPGVNFFVDETGKPRPMGRRNGKAAIFNKPFSDIEIVMGHGGQIGSCEAVFSPRGADGQPKPLFDRRTGLIDPAIAKFWERYDVRLFLDRKWPTLGPKLAHKLHVYVGGADTYYLEISAGMLKQSLARLGSDAVIDIIPGRDHDTLIDQKMRERIAREMAASFRRHHPRQ